MKWNYNYLIFLLLACGCSQRANKAAMFPHELVNAWTDMALYITQYTPANSPTYASRAFGYIGLTMYESVVPAFENFQSIASQLNGLELNTNSESPIHPLISFNAAQAAILKAIYQQTADSNIVKIDSLEKTLLNQLKIGINKRELRQSIEFGQSISAQIYKWSKSDGGHRGYLRNFDKEWQHPTHIGHWQPPLYAQSFSHHPLHPHWGKNRTFLKENENLATPQMIAFDSTPGSDYYNEFMEVYQKDQILTQEEKETAIWWGDDPDDTFTPPGHSFYIASLVVAAKKVDLITAAQTYAAVGLSVADAFINCWKWKYHYFSERPNTFIPRYIDQRWESFWPDPPFPCFPSGHAIQASAATVALEHIYGPAFAFIDSSHVGRERDEIRDVDFVERAFSTFWDVALETADSRFYGGIHTAQDNRVGLEEGRRIANHVSNLKWRSNE